MLNFQTHLEDDPKPDPVTPKSGETAGNSAGLPAAAETEDPGSLSLLGGVASGQTFDTDALGLETTTARKVPQTAIAVVAVVLVAGAALFAMKMSSDPMPADAATQQFEAEIDTAIQKLQNPGAMSPSDPLQPDRLREFAQRPDQVIQQFDNQRDRVNVPLREVKTNPFKFGNDQPSAEPVRDDSVERAAEALAMRTATLQRQVDAMKLQSVMNGPNPVAVIDGEFLRVGSAIGEFTLKDIGRLSVTLEADGLSFVLKVKR